MSTDAETAATRAAPSDDAAPAGTAFGPGGRPTGGLRPYLAGLLLLGAVLAVPIMLSDRAPDFFDRVTDTIEERWFPDVWWDDIKPLVPEADVAMHVLFFGGLALVVGLLSWSWRTFALGQLGVLALGTGLELLQPVFTTSRNIQLHDVVSNVGGQVLGIGVALLAVQVLRWRRGAEGRRRSR